MPRRYSSNFESSPEFTNPDLGIDSMGLLGQVFARKCNQQEIRFQVNVAAKQGNLSDDERASLLREQQVNLKLYIRLHKDFLAVNQQIKNLEAYLEKSKLTTSPIIQNSLDSVQENLAELQAQRAELSYEIEQTNNELIPALQDNFENL